MCGRYVSPEDYEAESEMEISRRRPNKWYQYSFNVAPTQQVPVVRFADGEREGVLMRWGLVPVWANGVPTKYSTINATVEEIETGPAWRSAWRSGKRCIMVASGFYEWKLLDDGSKQPFYIHCNDQKVFGFAALWDSSSTDGGETIESCAIITLPANSFMAEIHNDRKRMPAILAKADYNIWLHGTPSESLAVLQQYPEENLEAWPVGKRVNTPKNNGPGLIEPITRPIPQRLADK